MNNPNFNPIEFDGIKNQSGLNSFVLISKKWIEKTSAILITEGFEQKSRIEKLNKVAISQMRTLTCFRSDSTITMPMSKIK